MNKKSTIFSIFKKINLLLISCSMKKMEQAMGLEPISSAWKAEILANWTMPAWLRRQDLNLYQRSQSPLCCHYTTPHEKSGEEGNWTPNFWMQIRCFTIELLPHEENGVANGIWTHTNRAEVCYATPTTS